MNRTVRVTAYVAEEVDVEVSLSDVIREADPDQLEEFAGEIDTQLSKSVSTAPGPFSRARIVDAAYHAARALPECPEPIRELFWRVYGRAL